MNDDSAFAIFILDVHLGSDTLAGAVFEVADVSVFRGSLRLASRFLLSSPEGRDDSLGFSNRETFLLNA